MENIAKILVEAGHAAIVVPRLILAGLEEGRRHSSALPIERPFCPRHIEAAAFACRPFARGIAPRLACKKEIVIIAEVVVVVAHICPSAKARFKKPTLPSANEPAMCMVTTA